MDKYELEKIVGQGSFGKALLCKRKVDARRCIIKQISLAKMSKKEAKQTEQEAILLGRLRHPNIVTFWESFSSGANLYIVMDFADGGDLDQFIKKRKGRNVNEGEVLQLFVQLSLAIKHTHDRKILHRDLKPQNIFLTSAGLIKLGDFGVSRVLKNTCELAATQIGTPYYMSPEIFENKKYNSKSDIWSLGCILFEIMALKVPFTGTSMRQLTTNIISGNIQCPIPSLYSGPLRELVRDMLNKNPAVRPGVNNVLQRPVVQGKIAQYLGASQRNIEFNHTVLHGLNILQQPPAAVAAVAAPRLPLASIPERGPGPCPGPGRGPGLGPGLGPGPGLVRPAPPRVGVVAPPSAAAGNGYGGGNGVAARYNGYPAATPMIPPGAGNGAVAARVGVPLAAYAAVPQPQPSAAAAGMQQQQQQQQQYGVAAAAGRPAGAGAGAGGYAPPNKQPPAPFANNPFGPVVGANAAAAAANAGVAAVAAAEQAARYKEREREREREAAAAAAVAAMRGERDRMQREQELRAAAEIDRQRAAAKAQWEVQERLRAKQRKDQLLELERKKQLEQQRQQVAEYQRQLQIQIDKKKREEEQQKALRDEAVKKLAKEREERAVQRVKDAEAMQRVKEGAVQRVKDAEAAEAAAAVAAQKRRQEALAKNKEAAARILSPAAANKDKEAEKRQQQRPPLYSPRSEAAALLLSPARLQQQLGLPGKGNPPPPPNSKAQLAVAPIARGGGGAAAAAVAAAAARPPVPVQQKRPASAAVAHTAAGGLPERLNIRDDGKYRAVAAPSSWLDNLQDQMSHLKLQVKHIQDQRSPVPGVGISPNPGGEAFRRDKDDDVAPAPAAAPAAAPSAAAPAAPAMVQSPSHDDNSTVASDAATPRVRAAAGGGGGGERGGVGGGGERGGERRAGERGGERGGEEDGSDGRNKHQQGGGAAGAGAGAAVGADTRWLSNLENQMGDLRQKVKHIQAQRSPVPGTDPSEGGGEGGNDGGFGFAVGKAYGGRNGEIIAVAVDVNAMKRAAPISNGQRPSSAPRLAGAGGAGNKVLGAVAAADRNPPRGAAPTTVAAAVAAAGGGRGAKGVVSKAGGAAGAVAVGIQIVARAPVRLDNKLSPTPIIPQPSRAAAAAAGRVVKKPSAAAVGGAGKGKGRSPAAAGAGKSPAAAAAGGGGAAGILNQHGLSPHQQQQQKLQREKEAQKRQQEQLLQERREKREHQRQDMKEFIKAQRAGKGAAAAGVQKRGDEDQDQDKGGELSLGGEDEESSIQAQKRKDEHELQRDQQRKDFHEFIKSQRETRLRRSQQRSSIRSSESSDSEAAAAVGLGTMGLGMMGVQSGAAVAETEGVAIYTPEAPKTPASAAAAYIPAPAAVATKPQPASLKVPTSARKTPSQLPAGRNILANTKDGKTAVRSSVDSVSVKPASSKANAPKTRSLVSRSIDGNVQQQYTLAADELRKQHDAEREELKRQIAKQKDHLRKQPKDASKEGDTGIEIREGRSPARIPTTQASSHPPPTASAYASVQDLTEHRPVTKEAGTSLLPNTDDNDDDDDMPRGDHLDDRDAADRVDNPLSDDNGNEFFYSDLDPAEIAAASAAATAMAAGGGSGRGAVGFNNIPAALLLTDNTGVQGSISKGKSLRPQDASNTNSSGLVPDIDMEKLRGTMTSTGATAVGQHHHAHSSTNTGSGSSGEGPPQPGCFQILSNCFSAQRHAAISPRDTFPLPQEVNEVEGTRYLPGNDSSSDKVLTATATTEATATATTAAAAAAAAAAADDVKVHSEAPPAVVVDNTTSSSSSNNRAVAWSDTTTASDPLDTTSTSKDDSRPTGATTISSRGRTGSNATSRFSEATTVRAGVTRLTDTRYIPTDEEIYANDMFDSNPQLLGAATRRSNDATAAVCDNSEVEEEVEVEVGQQQQQGNGYAEELLEGYVNGDDELDSYDVVRRDEVEVAVENGDDGKSLSDEELTPFLFDDTGGEEEEEDCSEAEKQEAEDDFDLIDAQHGVVGQHHNYVTPQGKGGGGGPFAHSNLSSTASALRGVLLNRITAQTALEYSMLLEQMQDILRIVPASAADHTTAATPATATATASVGVGATEKTRPSNNDNSPLEGNALAGDDDYFDEDDEEHARELELQEVERDIPEEDETEYRSEVGEGVGEEEHQTFGSDFVGDDDQYGDVGGAYVLDEDGGVFAQEFNHFLEAEEARQHGILENDDNNDVDNNDDAGGGDSVAADDEEEYAQSKPDAPPVSDMEGYITEQRVYNEVIEDAFEEDYSEEEDDNGSFDNELQSLGDNEPGLTSAALYEYLEGELGGGKLARAMVFLRGVDSIVPGDIGGDVDDYLLTVMEKIVGSEGLTYLDDMFQLIVLEDEEEEEEKGEDE